MPRAERTDVGGYVYHILNRANARVQIFDREGGFLGKFGRLGDASGNLSRPKGVAVDNNGYIYIVDGLFHSVQIFDHRGKLLLPVGQHGQAAGEFWLPAGIFIEAQGDIYVADSHNRRVQVLRYVGGKP